MITKLPTVTVVRTCLYVFMHAYIYFIKKKEKEEDRGPPSDAYIDYYSNHARPFSICARPFNIPAHPFSIYALTYRIHANTDCNCVYL